MSNGTSKVTFINSLIRATAVLWIGSIATFASADFDAAGAFNSKCSGCHSVGKGVVVGPDLKGVGARHDRVWLHRFIRSSQSVVRSGDASARALFEQFGKIMPDHDFAAGEIDQLLDYIAAGGPAEAPLPELRHASTATEEEIARGRALFLGETPFAAGAAACVRCHVAGAAAWAGGSSLASDLSRSYAVLRDRGMASALRWPSHSPMRRGFSGQPLTAEEIFALKAFLHHTAQRPVPEVRAVHPFVFAGIGGAGLVLWMRRRRSR